MGLIQIRFVENHKLFLCIKKYCIIIISKSYIYANYHGHDIQLLTQLLN
jgi:hypothetical protein